MSNKKIAIDCRMINHSGIGTFIQGILEELSGFTQQYDFLLIGSYDELESYCQNNVTILQNSAAIFSYKEFYNFPTKSINECDAFLAPNFNIPLGVKVPIICVIHDVLFLDHPEIVNSSIGRLIRQLFITRAIKKTKKLVTVSEFSKSRIVNFYNNAKVTVAYNGVPKDVVEYRKENQFIEKDNYFVYVGNLKKQKGIQILIEAFNILGSNYKLKIVGRTENLRTADEEIQRLFENNNTGNIEFTGFLKREDLLNTISKAKALIQPSIYEGFGLPPIEALTLGTHCILSDIPVFREVYDGEPVSFFKTEDTDALVSVIMKTDYTKNINTSVVEKYSYKNTLETILKDIL